MKFRSILMVTLLTVAGGLVACTPASTPDVTPTPPREVKPIPQASPLPQTQATALVNLNLRQGPGTNYGVAGSLPADTSITVVGRNEDSTWLSAETKDGLPVWVTGDPGLIKVDSAQLSNLPVVEVPKPTYNVSHPKVNELLNLIPLVIHHDGFFTCASHGGLNQLLPEVVEGHVIGPHANDFVWGDQGNVLFRVTNGTLELVRENPVARFEGGAKSIPLEPALQMFERGEIVWNGAFGQWPGRGVTGCDKSAPS